MLPESLQEGLWLAFLLRCTVDVDDGLTQTHSGVHHPGLKDALGLI